MLACGRGAFVDQRGLFSYIAPEARVPANHPLRKIRVLVRAMMGELNRSLGKLYLCPRPVSSLGDELFRYGSFTRVPQSI